MTTSHPAGRAAAVARVRQHVTNATEEAANAGYMIAINLGQLVDDVVEAFDLDQLKLPRYYPDDEGHGTAYLVGTDRGRDADGNSDSFYTWWRTGLPGGRMVLNFGFGQGAAAGRDDCAIASVITDPVTIGNVCRTLLAASIHSEANPAPTGGLIDTGSETVDADNGDDQTQGDQPSVPQE